MSKVVAGAAMATLSGATVTGGGWLIYIGLKQSSDANAGQDRETQLSVDASIPKTLQDFKTNGHNQHCVKTLFPKLASVQGAEQDSSTAAANFLESSTKTTGCLVVNWEKKNDSDQWKGKFRLLWALKGEASGTRKGFMVFLAGKTPTSGSAKEIQWEAIVYTLTGTESEATTTWMAKSRQEVASGKSFKKENDAVQENKFPRPSSDFKAKDNANVPAFWGWFEAGTALDKISISSYDTPTEETSFRAHWDWAGTEGGTAQGSQNLLGWTQSMETWWPAIFDSTFTVKTIADNRQGSWTIGTYS